MERPLFARVLEQCNGNQCKAADMLGINRATLRTKLWRYGILASTFRKRVQRAYQPKKKELVTPPGWRRELKTIQEKT